MALESGFTLIEVIIAMGISVIIGVLLINVLSNNTGLFYKENGVLSNGISQNFVSSEIAKYIRQSAQVATQYPQSAPIYITGSSTLILQIPGLDINGNILTSIYDYIVVYIDSTNSNTLRLQIYPDPASKRGALNEVLTTLLSSINFSYLDLNNNSVAPSAAAQVETNFTLLSKTGSIGPTANQDFKTTLRNH